jgi:hypothetical protein
MSDITNWMIWAWITLEGKKRFTQNCGGKPTGRRPLGRYGLGQGSTIHLVLREMAFESLGWIDLAQDRYRWWASINTITNYGVQILEGLRD